jgi:YEATS domain-containing protein 4
LLAAIEKPPFEVTETGWGEFDIIIKIFFVAEAAEKPITFTHHLKLHPWPVEGAIPPSLPAPLPAGTSPQPLAVIPEAPQGPQPIISPIHSWQYEEVVFSEPTETFYSLLLSRPPTPLPLTNRNPDILTLALGGGGNFGEFTERMEKEEGERLEAARLKVLEEIETLRKKLIGNEKELLGV